MGDWDGNGLVDSGDLALWQQRYNPLGLAAVQTQLSMPVAYTKSYTPHRLASGANKTSRESVDLPPLPLISPRPRLCRKPREAAATLRIAGASARLARPAGLSSRMPGRWAKVRRQRRVGAAVQGVQQLRGWPLLRTLDEAPIHLLRVLRPSTPTRK